MSAGAGKGAGDSNSRCTHHPVVDRLTGAGVGKDFIAAVCQGDVGIAAGICLACLHHRRMLILLAGKHQDVAADVLVLAACQVGKVDVLGAGVAGACIEGHRVAGADIFKEQIAALLAAGAVAIVDAV